MITLNIMKSKQLTSANKPGSVEDSHSSGLPVTKQLLRPTRTRRGTALWNACKEQTLRVPIWSCSRWGLLCRKGYPLRGALLPHLFTLTRKGRNPQSGGLFSVALSVGLRLPEVIWHLALWSPDFPPYFEIERLSRLTLLFTSNPSFLREIVQSFN